MKRDTPPRLFGLPDFGLNQVNPGKPWKYGKRETRCCGDTRLDSLDLIRTVRTGFATARHHKHPSRWQTHPTITPVAICLTLLHHISPTASMCVGVCVGELFDPRPSRLSRQVGTPPLTSLTSLTSLTFSYFSHTHPTTPQFRPQVQYVVSHITVDGSYEPTPPSPTPPAIVAS
ncbi:hypothetical protein EX30DRAFT_245998 [Ascodesmis nigricans]|uniref:Uncharacterized protein n=1 Tax=Ascodesmis nigricans TaxID=341454 RepID=A0A4S2MQ72_9PEZI|nr:hypothetical protein EX30DRAFT_245998 [Ascodesmis nigricans]